MEPVDLVELGAVEPAHMVKQAREVQMALILIQVKLILAEAEAALKEPELLPEQLQKEAHGKELLVAQE